MCGAGAHAILLLSSEQGASMSTQHSRRALVAFVLCTVVPFAGAASGPPLDESDESRLELIEAARLTPNLPTGADLFETCAACHGRDGLGTSDGTVPAIAGQHGSVLLKQLVDFRHNQRWDERMQHFSDQHHLAGAQELTHVTAYIAGLRRFAPRMNAVGTGQYLQQG